MSEPAGGALPAPQLAEVISSLENCEWALTRAREAITSMVAALRGQPQRAQEPQVKDEDDENTSVIKTEPDSDVEFICVRPIPKARAGPRLEGERCIREESNSGEPATSMQIEGRQSTIPVVTLGPTGSKKKAKRKRTEAQCEARRRRRMRAKARKQEAASLRFNCLEGPRPPLADLSSVGTAANRDALPFNRLKIPPANIEMPPANVEPTLMLPKAPDGYQFGGLGLQHNFPSVGAFHQDGRTSDPMLYFPPETPGPTLSTNPQQKFFFHSTRIMPLLEGYGGASGHEPGDLNKCSTMFMNMGQENGTHLDVFDY